MPKTADEVKAAAKWMAMKGKTGKVGEHLPIAISKNAVRWINNNLAKFKRMVHAAKPTTIKPPKKLIKLTERRAKKALEGLKNPMERYETEVGVFDVYKVDHDKWKPWRIMRIKPEYGQVWYFRLKKDALRFLSGGGTFTLKKVSRPKGKKKAAPKKKKISAARRDMVEGLYEEVLSEYEHEPYWAIGSKAGTKRFIDTIAASKMTESKIKFAMRLVEEGMKPQEAIKRAKTGKNPKKKAAKKKVAKKKTKNSVARAANRQKWVYKATVHHGESGSIWHVTKHPYGKPDEWEIVRGFRSRDAAMRFLDKRKKSEGKQRKKATKRGRK